MKRFWIFAIAFILMIGGVTMSLAPMKKPLPMKPLAVYAQDSAIENQIQEDSQDEIQEDIPGDIEEDIQEDIEERVEVGEAESDTLTEQEASNLQNTSSEVVEYDSEEQIKLRVFGSAQKEIEPDSAVISAVITALDEDATACKDKAFQKFDQVVSFLESKGIAKEEIVVESFVDRACGGRFCPRENGYHATLNFNFKISSLDGLKDILAEMKDNGASEICDVCYQSSKIEEEYNQVLTDAVENAKAKASKLLGEGLELVEICEEGVYCGNCLYREYVEGQELFAGKITICAKVIAQFVQA